MSDSGYLKCACEKCGGHIEFPSAGVGQTIPCPRCGALTRLLAKPVAASRVPAKFPLKSGRKISAAVGAAAFILILIVAGLILFHAKLFSAAAPPVVQPIAQPAPTNPVPKKVFVRLNDFNVGPVKLKKTDGSSLVYAVGTIANDSNRQRFGVRVTLDLLDADGNKIGTASDYISVIEPHKDWQFKALLTEPKVFKAKPAYIEEEK
jgi:hypothetical protein